MKKTELLKVTGRRIVIKPMTDKELEKAAYTQNDPHLKQAYTEMMEKTRKYPEDRIWFTDWKIELCSGEIIGGIGFKGPPSKEQCAVEIGYGIDEAYRCCGYATEAVAAMCNWAFSKENCNFVRAQTEEGNLASERVLAKCNFLPAGMGEEGRLWEKEKPRTYNAPIFMSIFLSLGLCLGLAFDNLAIGLCLGVALGLCIGTALDFYDEKRRASQRKAEKTTYKDK